MPDSPYFHIAILVRNLEEAMQRYERVLSVSFLTAKPFTIERLVDALHFGDEDPHPWTGRAVYSRQGPPFYELLEAKGHGVFSLDGREEGFHHIGVFVDDTHGSCLALADHGVGQSARILGADGRTRVGFSEPAALHGLRLELLDSSSTIVADILAEAAALDAEEPAGAHADGR